MTDQDSPSSPISAPEEKPSEPSFFSELKRRKVFRVAITYSIVAWLIIQIAAATFGGFGIPEWAFRFVVIMLVLGFPVALIITWAFELTPEGVKLTKHVSETEKVKTSSGKRNWFAFVFAAGLPTLIFGALALFFYFNRGVPQVELAGLDKSIAVLPFRNMSADEHNEYFCDGVQEDILTTLANVSDLKVISRTSVMQYKGSDKAIPEIGKELGVSYILEGSVQRFGNRVRVTGQLINAKTDEHLWARNYDHDLNDIFALQAELSKEIATSLQAVLTPEEVERMEEVNPVNPAAYDLVQKGRSSLNTATNTTEEYFYRSEALFYSATEMDPNYADAWVGLSYVHVRNYFVGNDRSEERLEKAKMAIDKAMEIAPESPQVLIGLGNYFYYGYRDYEAAREQYEKVLRKSPNNAEALASLGYIARREGRWKATTRYLKQSFQLDPNNVVTASNYFDHMEALRHLDTVKELASHVERLLKDKDPYVELAALLKIARLDGDYQEALEYTETLSDRVLENPDIYQMFLNYYAYEGKAQEYVDLFESDQPIDVSEVGYWLARYTIALKIVGRDEEAAKQLPKLIELTKDVTTANPSEPVPYLFYGMALAVSGDREGAMAMIRKANELFDDNDALIAIRIRENTFYILSWLGETEQALELLDQNLKEPYGPNVYADRRRLFNYPLWENERFQEIMNDPANRAPLFE